MGAKITTFERKSKYLDHAWTPYRVTISHYKIMSWKHMSTWGEYLAKMCLISSQKLNISITCIFVVLQSGRWLIEVDSDPGRTRPFSPFSHSDWGTRGRYKWPARLACKWGLQLLVINNIGQTTQLEYPPRCISSLWLQVELKMEFRVFFLLQIATTSFARKSKAKVLHKRNIGVLENKQKRFTEHPPRKKNKFLEISHRSVRI